MANNDNAIKFTEVKYTSRREMSNELGILVPEDMWKKIENYRQSFYTVLPLKNAEDRNLFLCLYPTFSSKESQINAKLSRLVADYNKLDELNGDKEHFKLSVAVQEIKALAEKNGIEIEPQRLKKLLISENPFDDGEERLLNYFYAVKYIESSYVNPINDDFLADLYSRVTGISELTYFYRDRNISDIDSIALVSRVYKSAPVDKIEPMMESLFSYIANGEGTALNKALISYYFVSYVKPFRDFNEEIAILIAKSVLANASLGEVGSIVPFEFLLNQKADAVRKMTQEVVSSADVTYFVSPTANHLDKDIDEIFDILREYSVKTIRNDFYKIDEEPAPAKEVIVEKKEEVIAEEKPVVQEAPIVKEAKEEPKEVVIETVELFPEEEPAPVVEEKPLPEKEEKVIATPKVKAEPKQVVSTEIAFGYIPTKIDEKEAQRLEEHLLELDYRLKKGEAKFYARHCTLGMYYTIEQYRKCVKCVYETARTSMDHLAELGYYNKEKVGKKFVYTPVKRK